MPDDHPLGCALARRTPTHVTGPPEEFTISDTTTPVLPQRRNASVIALYLAVFLLATTLRLLPVLNGGGLFGYGNYDDGVYFAASVALVHGLLPYRDFLLLHPPGVPILAAPFAALTYLVPDPIAFAAGRVGWMVLGGVNAVLAAATLRRMGRFAVAVAGISYAVFFPAVYGEHSTLLEAPANTVLLATLLIISRTRIDRGPATGSPLPWLIAGALTGLSPAFKIWGVVPLLILTVWVGVRGGRRRIRPWLLGAALALVVTLGPFFLAAPVRMWTLVVRDQLGRLSTGWKPVTRLNVLLGLSTYHLTGFGPVLVLAVLMWTVATLIALRSTASRLYAVMHLIMGAFMMGIPTWFMHYATFVAPSAALVTGSAAGAAGRWLGSRAARWRRPICVAALVVLVVSAAPLTWAKFGTSFPRAALEASVAGSGCTTSDDPTNLLELDVFSRNLRRHCPLVVDLGGYSYNQDLGGGQVPRVENPIWQQTARRYLGSGSRTVLSRFATSGQRGPFDPGTKRLIARWPVLARSHGTTVRAPSVR